MRCDEKDSLMEKHEETVQAYSQAVVKMREYGAALPLAEFKLLWEVAVRANSLCRSAHYALRRHVAEHTC